MRISELSRASATPVPTLKFYLREGLLPPGAVTGPNQAEYGEDHLRRLRLIRTLTDVGRLKLRDVGAVLEALDDERISTHELLGIAHHALGPEEREGEASPELAAAEAEIDRFIKALAWGVGKDAPARRLLAQALLTLRRFGRAADVRVFEPYAKAADRLAAREVARVPSNGSRAEALEAVVVGTVAFESALVALRRLAQESHSAKRFSGGSHRTPSAKRA